MSIESWKAEFYPIPAEAVPEDQALNHSYRKWQGLLPENLARHGLIQVGTMLFVDEGITDEYQIQMQQNPVFYVDGISCALCFHHHSKSEKNDFVLCGNCPLRKVRGVPCDSTLGVGDNAISPYAAFTLRKDPRPMLDWLVIAIERRSDPAETREGELLEGNDV